jgi:5-formyltetrahydrofolate cyclo-ligase
MEEMESADEILLYYPITDEINLLGLLGPFGRKRFYLPRITESGHLIFCQYRQGDPLRNNAYMIPEPATTPRLYKPEKSKTVILVPSLMVDLYGYRLGYGKGFYDRFFAEIPRGLPIIRIAPIAEALLTEALPIDPWDQRVDRIITEQRLLITKTPGNPES